jgi:hypothetical protein
VRIHKRGGAARKHIAKNAIATHRSFFDLMQHGLTTKLKSATAQQKQQLM